MSRRPDLWELVANQIDPPTRDIEPWRDNPASLAAHLTRNEPPNMRFVIYRHTQLIADKLVAAVCGGHNRIIINVAGRRGKTLVVLWFLVWLLDRNPGARSIYTTYGIELAREGGIFVRDKLRNYSDQLSCQLTADRQTQNRFTTEQGGGLLAAQIGAGITGFGAGDGGALLIDDPMKNWQEAHSANARDNVFNQYLGTLRNRLDSEDTPIVVLHTRWHEDDLTGRLLDRMANNSGEQWELVKIPALATPDPDGVMRDPLGRAEGESDWPERFPVADIRQRHLGMSSYLVSALEQQDPSPEEGTEILRAWFRLDEDPPDSYDEAITSWDLKLKDREAGDYVVGQVWWRCGSTFWLIDQIRGRYDHATTANAIALLSVRHPDVMQHVVEAAGSHDDVLPVLGKALPDYVIDDDMAARLSMTDSERVAVQELRRRGMPGLLPHPVKGDKKVRARAFIAPLAEPGNVRIRPLASFVDTYLDEVAAFPNGSHDDQVDASSQALQRLSRQRRARPGPLGPAGPKQSSAWR